MPRNDRMPGPRQGVVRELAELRRLAEEGRASGLSEEDGEALLDRLAARYRSLVERKPGI